jgi:hypothetical protein
VFTAPKPSKATTNLQLANNQTGHQLILNPPRGGGFRPAGDEE